MDREDEVRVTCSTTVLGESALNNMIGFYVYIRICVCMGCQRLMLDDSLAHSVVSFLRKALSLPLARTNKLD